MAAKRERQQQLGGRHTKKLPYPRSSLLILREGHGTRSLRLPYGKLFREAIDSERRHRGSTAIRRTRPPRTGIGAGKTSQTKHHRLHAHGVAQHGVESIDDLVDLEQCGQRGTEFSDRRPIVDARAVEGTVHDSLQHPPRGIEGHRGDEEHDKLENLGLGPRHKCRSEAHQKRIATDHADRQGGIDERLANEAIDFEEVVAGDRPGDTSGEDRREHKPELHWQTAAREGAVDQGYEGERSGEHCAGEERLRALLRRDSARAIAPHQVAEEEDEARARGEVGQVQRSEARGPRLDARDHEQGECRSGRICHHRRRHTRPPRLPGLGENGRQVNPRGGEETLQQEVEATQPESVSIVKEDRAHRIEPGDQRLPEEGGRRPPGRPQEADDDAEAQPRSAEEEQHTEGLQVVDDREAACS